MITSIVNLANLASGYCVIHVSECGVGEIFHRVKCPHLTKLYVILETKWTLKHLWG